MALSLNLRWQAPVTIRRGRRDEALYWVCDDVDALPDEPGAYVFARKFGDSLLPLYIGQATNIRTRVVQHLKGNVTLLKAIDHAKSGARQVLPCVLRTKPGQKRAQCLDVLEQTLISQALLDGHLIFNKQGAKRPTHTLTFGGARAGTRIFGTTLRTEA